MPKMPRILAIPDTHFPFAEMKAIKLVYDAIDDLKPDVVIQLGDVLDCYSWAKFSRSQDLMTPKEEIEQGLGDYKVFWKTIRKIVGPKKRLIQLGGNHTDRFVRIASSKAPELTWFINPKPHFQIEGLELHMDSHDEVEVEGIVFVHGWLSGIGKHAQYFGQSTVHGHTHTGGLWTQTFREPGTKKTRSLFELDCGYLADPYQVPLMYRATKMPKWTMGFGFIDQWGPRFCPLSVR